MSDVFQPLDVMPECALISYVNLATSKKQKAQTRGRTENPMIRSHVP